MSDQAWTGAARAKVQAAYAAMTPGPWKASQSTHPIKDGSGSATVSSPSQHCAIYINVGAGYHSDTIARWHADAAGIVAVVNAYPLMEAALTEMEQALLPFKRFVDGWNRGRPDDEVLASVAVPGSGGTKVRDVITLGDLRRARDVLAKYTTEGK